MDILVINCGSSSIKMDVVDSENGERKLKLRASRIGTAGCEVSLRDQQVQFPDATYAEVLTESLKMVDVPFRAIGHRVVHGGEEFLRPIRITSDVFVQLEALVDLAPLHLPHNLNGIRFCSDLFPEMIQVAVFDTAFHATLPRRSKQYALPKTLTDKYGIRRFGFHGLSHRWATGLTAKFFNEDPQNLKIITCHLGNGASVCAVEFGRSIETSMGMTPLEGLMMGTRAGDVDAGALFYLMEKEGMTVDDLNHLLNKSSGLEGLSNNGHDMRDISAAAMNGDDSARLAINVFVHRLKKYIGAYAAVLNGVDAIVFTGGIGENSHIVRSRVCQSLGYLGVRVDDDRNTHGLADEKIVDISMERARTRVIVLRTDEERMIAQDTAGLVNERDIVPETALNIPIAVSARHAHLTQEAVEILFGTGATLTKYKDISQPGQFACNETVDVVGPKRTIQGVRIIGPVRPKCQVEISRTDEFTLGVDAPIRNSGDVQNSPGVKLIGPKGELILEEGLICARRHIHMHTDDAVQFGVADRDVVDVSVTSDGRSLTFGDVLVRVSPKYVLEMHIDTDEANAAEITSSTQATLASVNGSAVALSRIHLR